MFYVISLLTLPYPNTLPNLRIFLNLSMCTLIKNCFITKDFLSVNATQKRLISMQNFCKDKNAMNLNTGQDNTYMLDCQLPRDNNLKDAICWV